MPGPIYYQWQNDFLLRTIYPLRETKLRDFLLFFYEIDIWQQYKGKTTAAIPKDVEEYCGARRKKVTDAYDRSQKLEAYLLTEDVTAAYKQRFPTPDPETLAKINELHKLFKRYYPTYKNPVKEKYFVSERVRQFEELRKKLDSYIKDRKRVLRNMGPTWGKKAATEAEVERLSTIAIPMIEQELQTLYDFLASLERLTALRSDLNKRKAGMEKQRSDALTRLKAMQTEQETLQPRLGKVQRALARLKATPTFDLIKAYFLDTTAAGKYQQRFPKVDAAVIKRVDETHKAFAQFFPGYTSVAQQKNFVAQRLLELENLVKVKDQELVSKRRTLGWTDTAAPAYAAVREAVDVLQNQTLIVLEEELGKLQDMQFALQKREKPAADRSAAIAQAEKERVEVDAKLKKNVAEESTIRETVKQAESALSGAEKDQILAALEPCQVTVQEIVRGKVEDYRASLDAMTPSQLLEAVVEKFVTNPERYPLWLQYMVIHFSGMRYQSAHGSWADPRDLLASLRTKAVEQEFKRASTDAIDALCDQKYLCYKSALSGEQVLTAAEGESLPGLALAKEPVWRARAEFHLKTLDPAKGYYRRKALLDLRLTEEDYDISRLTDPQITDELETLKDQLPEWMWKEIVRVTELRLKEVGDANWEQVTTEESQARYEKGMDMYREILDKWKRENITGWREEHDRANRLIVTRAVCNEVAEHIQHLRGLTPPGGLTAKPEWYMRLHKDPKQANRPDKPYFVKTRSAKDLRPGASIFWLRWVNKEPNMWQIARPLTLPSGEEMVPLLSDARSSITTTGSSYLRRSTWQEKGPDGRPINRSETSWLRWMHEATIVEVTETADGPTVLTFETALPNEDRRQSTIGVFKHAADWLNYNVTASAMTGTLVGYVPEAAVPYADLKELLDWNKILLRNAYTPAQIAAFWQKVEKPVAFALPEYDEMIPVEAAPALLPPQTHREWIVCYERGADGNLVVYQPEVALRRGMAISISMEKAVTWNGETYSKVTGCDPEPRAEGLYIPAAHVIDTPEGKSRRPVEAKRALSFYRLAGVDENGVPLFEPSGLGAKPGTTFQISTVHKLRDTDPGRGRVVGGKNRQYVLVVESPRVDSAEGLFVRASDVRRVIKQRYIDSFFEL